jgi:hypothetical protein
MADDYHFEVFLRDLAVSVDDFIEDVLELSCFDPDLFEEFHSDVHDTYLYCKTAFSEFEIGD